MRDSRGLAIKYKAFYASKKAWQEARIVEYFAYRALHVFPLPQKKRAGCVMRGKSACLPKGAFPHSAFMRGSDIGAPFFLRMFLSRACGAEISVFRSLPIFRFRITAQTGCIGRLPKRPTRQIRQKIRQPALCFATGPPSRIQSLPQTL